MRVWAWRPTHLGSFFHKLRARSSGMCLDPFLYIFRLTIDLWKKKNWTWLSLWLGLQIRQVGPQHTIYFLFNAFFITQFKKMQFYLLLLIIFFFKLKQKKITWPFVINNMLLLIKSHEFVMVCFFFLKKIFYTKNNYHALCCHINLLNEK
jgi:hypothetical protein